MFEQVRAGIGRLDPVLNYMRQGRLDHLPGMIRLQPFGNTGHGPVPRSRGDESEQETGSPNDRGMIDDFRIWGSRRCRRMGEYSTETRLFTWMVHTLDNHNASLSEGGALAAVVRDFP